VVNANYVSSGAGLSFDDGFIQVVDREQWAPVARWDLPLKNPVRIRVIGEDAWVLCAGAYTQGDDGNYYSESPGGLILIPNGGADPLDVGPIESFPLGDDGSVGSWVVQEDQARLLLGSSLVAEIYVFDLVARSWTHDRSNPIVRPETVANETLTLALHPDGSIAVFSFTRNRAVLLDATTLEDLDGMEEVALSESGELEGPISAVFVPGTEPPQAAIILTLSNFLARWTPEDANSMDPRWRSIGLSANEVLATAGHLYVVESGANTLALFPLPEGDPERIVFDVGADPYNMAVAPGGTTAYVTTLLENKLWEIDLSSGEKTRALGP